MSILDAYALEAFLADEPAADAVEALLLADEPPAIAAINLAEVVDRMVRVRGVELDVLRADIEELALSVVGLDEQAAYRAADLRSRHYQRTRRPVSLADCAAAALALQRETPLLTSDPALIDLVVAEGGAVRVLPGSDGSLHRAR